MVFEWMRQGIDPAHAIYEYARGKGYRAGSALPTEQKDVTSRPQQVEAKVKRLKHGLKDNAASATETTARSRSGTISAKAFYEQYPERDRIAIFQKHDEAFDQLVNNGEISVRYLPSSG